MSEGAWRKWGKGPALPHLPALRIRILGKHYISLANCQYVIGFRSDFDNESQDKVQL